MCECLSVCLYMHACVHACVCVRACVRACVRVKTGTLGYYLWHSALFALPRVSIIINM